jgi:hypothetical protein
MDRAVPQVPQQQPGHGAPSGAVWPTNVTWITPRNMAVPARSEHPNRRGPATVSFAGWSTP